MSLRLQKLSEIFIAVDELPWRSALYITGNYPWREDSLCAVLDSDELEPSDHAKDFVRTNNLRYCLGVQDIQDIVANARQQVAAISTSHLIEAFNFYYKHDAFIRFK